MISQRMASVLLAVSAVPDTFPYLNMGDKTGVSCEVSRGGYEERNLGGIDFDSIVHKSHK